MARKFRFSLHMLLCITTLLAVVLAVFGRAAISHLYRTRVANTLREGGAIVFLGDDFASVSYKDRNLTPSDAANIVAFPGQVILYLDGVKLGDGVLSQLSSGNLVDISIGNCQITQDQIDTLGTLKNVTRLLFGNVDLSQLDLKAIGSMPALTRAYFGSTSIGSQQLKDIANSVTITDLCLEEPRIDADALSALDRMRQLQKLSLNAKNLNDDDLIHIRNLVNLYSLDLAQTSVSEVGLAELPVLATLKHLNLEATNVTDNLITLLSKEQVMWLNVSGTNITDDGLSTAETLEGLWFIDLENTQVTPAGIAALRSSLPRLEITH